MIMAKFAAFAMMATSSYNFGMPILLKTCSRCGAAVRQVLSTARAIARADSAAYCSRECRRASVQRTCEACGRAFTLACSAVASRPSRWCSRECANLGRRQGETRSCARCQTAFYVYPSNLKRSGRVNLYCSRACGNAASAPLRTGVVRSSETRRRLSEAKRGVPNFKRRKPPIVVVCGGCSANFEVSRSRQNPLSARFCSTDCWYRYLRLHPEESATYRGGYEPYYGPNWPEKAKLARERDGHICQNCGLYQFNPRLDVHHIIPRRAFNGDFEAANVLSNLITLCKACHTKRERLMDA